MKVLMPQLGETVTEGTVSKWHKKIGDNVKTGEVLFEIETDKTSMEIPATSDGKLSKIHVTEGETSSVGATVAIIIGDNEEDEKETEQYEPTKEADKSQTKDAKEENKIIIEVPKRSNTDTQLENPENIDTEAPNWFTYLSEVLTPTEKYNEFIGNIDIKLTPLAKRIVANERLNLDQLASYFKNHKTRRVSRKQIDDYISLQ